MQRAGQRVTSRRQTLLLLAGGPQAHPAPSSKGPGGPPTPRAQQCPRGTPGTAGLRHSRPVESCPFPPLRAIYSTVSESQKPPTLRPHPY